MQALLVSGIIHQWTSTNLMEYLASPMLCSMGLVEIRDDPDDHPLCCYNWCSSSLLDTSRR
jgi:hypothetical protein